MGTIYLKFCVCDVKWSEGTFSSLHVYPVVTIYIYIYIYMYIYIYNVYSSLSLTLRFLNDFIFSHRISLSILNIRPLIDTCVGSVHPCLRPAFLFFDNGTFLKRRWFSF